MTGNATRSGTEPPGFMRLQRAFAAHVRDPLRNPPPPGIEERRMAVYRESFYNNIDGFLARSFPVLRRLTPDEAWHALVRDYFAHHRAHTPLFHEIPNEFLDYLRHERGAHAGDPPFLLELAHYEWVELALSLSEREIDWSGVDREGDLLEGVPVRSPLAWSLSYAFPVHRIGPDYLPDTPGAEPARLIVYRDRRDEIGFLEINAASARLLELLDQNPRLTGRAALERIACELHHPAPDAVLRGGLDTLRELLRRDVVLGAKARPR